MKLRNTILIGTLIRICLMPFFAHPFDVYAWYTVCVSIIKNGPLVIAYPLPMMFYTLIPIAYTYNLASTLIPMTPIPMEEIPAELNYFLRYKTLYDVKYVPGMLFNTIVKVPFIVSDIIIAILIYKIVEALTEKEGLAEKASAIWLLNPYVIFISSGWGMFDSLPALFCTASLYLLMKKKIRPAAVCLGVAAAYKLYPIVFLIPVLFYFTKTNQKNGRRDGLSFLLTFLSTSALLFLPFANRVLQTSMDLVSNTGGGPFAFGLTYWSISLALPLDANVSAFLSSALVVAFLAIVYWRTSKLTFEKPFIDLAASMLACILAIFLSYRIICEQYLVWALPFIIILCIEKRVEEALYRSLSLTALAYAVTYTWIPYFLLATTPWTGDILIAMVRLVYLFRKTRPDPTAPFTPSMSPGPILYTILGTAFSILALIMLTETLFKPREKLMKKLMPTWLDRILCKLRIQTAD